MNLSTKEKKEGEQASRSGQHAEARLSQEEYLDKFGVNVYLKDCITLVLENRPEKPLEFIADYLNNALHGKSSTQRSYRYIRLTRRNRQAFMDNLASAYFTLVRHSEMQGQSGLTGAQYLSLIKLFCSDFPPEVIESLTKVMDKKTSESISFSYFAAGINACLMYEEFFEHAEYIFNSCDVDAKGQVDYDVFISILRQMNQSSSDVLHESEGWNIPSCKLLDSARNVLAARERGAENKNVTYKEFIMAVIKIFVLRNENK
uniref:EF-hand domain-containing protein n=1 Tax=Guillardia theta TaxID=55529 RepID=A0A7S4KYP1_GUITH|mmetsp:Transcript_33909/g.106326  ORF Transcript_33909/g.106326 Transcript_33909/m.106326 type:complete len:260 (+) Transcript_33909:127-906(+)